MYLGSAVVSCRLVAPAAVEAGGGDEATASGTAAGGDGINLREYSGLVVKAIGDGKKYTAVVRTYVHVCARARGNQPSCRVSGLRAFVR